MPVAAILIILIGTAYIVMGFHTPLIGDDLGFRHTFAEQNDCLYALPALCTVTGYGTTHAWQTCSIP